MKLFEKPKKKPSNPFVNSTYSIQIPANRRDATAPAPTPPSSVGTTGPYFLCATKNQNVSSRRPLSSGPQAGARGVEKLLTVTRTEKPIPRGGCRRQSWTRNGESASSRSTWGCARSSGTSGLMRSRSPGTRTARLWRVRVFMCYISLSPFVYRPELSLQNSAALFFFFWIFPWPMSMIRWDLETKYCFTIVAPFWCFEAGGLVLQAVCEHLRFVVQLISKDCLHGSTINNIDDYIRWSLSSNKSQQSCPYIFRKKIYTPLHLLHQTSFTPITRLNITLKRKQKFQPHLHKLQLTVRISTTIILAYSKIP